MRSQALAGTAAIAVLVGSGCGGKGDEQQIRDVYTSYRAAIRAGDTAKACRFFAPAVRRQTRVGTAKLLNLRAPGQPARPRTKFSSCAQAVRDLLPIYRGVHPELGDITVHGNRATATLLGRTWFIDRPDPSARRPMAGFEKVSGEWKLGVPYP